MLYIFDISKKSFIINYIHNRERLKEKGGRDKLLYYETIKKDETSQWVVFIHGIGGSTLTWKKQIDDFSKNHNILLIDLAGHGKSRDMKSEHNIVGVPHEIKDILDYLNIQKAHFVGMSLGTLILVFYTLIYPDTVLSLTLGGAITSLSINGQIALWFAQVTKKILPQKATCDIFARVLMPKKNHELSRKIFIREALKMKKEEFLGWVGALNMTKYAAVYIDLLKNISAIPILYIMGSEDHLFLKGTQETAKKINADIELIDHCGHVCSIERAKEFNEIAINFIDNKVKALA